MLSPLVKKGLFSGHGQIIRKNQGPRQSTWLQVCPPLPPLTRLNGNLGGVRWVPLGFFQRTSGFQSQIPMSPTALKGLRGTTASDPVKQVVLQLEIGSPVTNKAEYSNTARHSEGCVCNQGHVSDRITPVKLQRPIKPQKGHEDVGAVPHSHVASRTLPGNQRCVHSLAPPSRGDYHAVYYRDPIAHMPIVTDTCVAWFLNPVNPVPPPFSSPCVRKTSNVSSFFHSL